MRIEDHGKANWTQIPSRKILNWESLSKYAAIAILFNDRDQFDKLFYQYAQKLIVYNAKDGILTSTNEYQVNQHKLLWDRWGVILQGQFHVIGGDGHYYHLKWDDNNKEFKKLYDLGKYGTDIIIKDVIKVSKNKIWIIGYDKQHNFIIREYLNGEDSWINRISLTQDPSLSKINELTSKLCCVSVYNHALLIIFGNQSWDDSIHIIDIQQETFRESAIKLPSICSKMYSSSTFDKKKNEMLVCGYCKQDIHVIVPYCLKQLIANWMVIEFIQIICGQGGDVSWRVNVDDILKFTDADQISDYVPSSFLNRTKRQRYTKRYSYIYKLDK